MRLLDERAQKAGLRLATEELPVRTAQAREGSICNHPQYDCLYDGDTLTSISNCPFPVKTSTFEVLAWGERQRKEGVEQVAVIAYRKACGHNAQDRIGFMEWVQDFEHCGTLFKGDDYKLASWERRIEFFRGYSCDVCRMAEHLAWLQEYRDTRLPGAKRLKQFRLLMNYNWSNWTSFISEAGFIKYAGLKNVQLEVKVKEGPC